MERCCNDVFSYCSTPERQSTQDHEIIEFGIGGKAYKITRPIPVCHHKPRNCPYLKNQSQLVIARPL